MQQNYQDELIFPEIIQQNEKNHTINRKGLLQKFANKSRNHAFSSQVYSSQKSDAIPRDNQQYHKAYSIVSITESPSPSPNAKQILKNSIISGRERNDHHFTTKESFFMMNGKMLVGSKKPIENQLSSFLLNINERIKQQSNKCNQCVELPKIQHKQKEIKQMKNKKYKYAQIFKNLGSLKSKKGIIPQEIEENEQISTKKYHTYQKRNTFSPKSALQKQSMPYSQTISHPMPQSQRLLQIKRNSQKQKPNFSTLSTKNLMKVQLLFKKGYISYDEEGRQFYDMFLSNTVQLPKEKSNLNIQKIITAKSYLVIDSQNLSIIASKNHTNQIEIASLSKIMTCYLSLLICKKYDINIYKYSSRVSQKSAQMPGTTAELQAGDVLTVYELLVGLMLPSGNDASVALAECLGKVIQRHKKKPTKKTYFETFLAHMNLLSKQLDLQQEWRNSSGLSFNPNTSTPLSLSILTSIAVRNQTFKKIITIKQYQIDIKNQRYGLLRKTRWKNTNKLLDLGWEGVKTGTTQTAGHCLMSKRGKLIISVYGCQTLKKRFQQCSKLYEFYKEYDSDENNL